MSFFVTSAGSGRGADLGGLEGADRHCQELAAKAGAGSRTWRAYLSTQGAGAVNARDRIGRGPWQNAKGEIIAQSVDELHGANKISKQTALTETGEPVKGRGDTPNMHDILTGSQADGRAFTGADDMTCRNWTSAESRRRDGRPPRPHGASRRRAVEILEHVAPVARPERRLQPGRAARHRRRRPVLLLRGELRGLGSPHPLRMRDPHRRTGRDGEERGDGERVAHARRHRRGHAGHGVTVPRPCGDSLTGALQGGPGA